MRLGIWDRAFMLMNQGKLVASLAKHYEYPKSELSSARDTSNSSWFYQLVKDFNPNILFLMETKSQQSRMVYVLSKFDFDNVFTVDSVSSRGGLALY